MKTKMTMIAAVLLLALTGCGTVTTGGTAETKTGRTGAESYWQDLPDGSRVACVTLYSESITCDWAHKVAEIGGDK